MQRLYAPRSRRGDRVGGGYAVLAGFDVAVPDPHGELERGMETLRDLGFEPVLGEHALASEVYMAGRPEQRASDINRTFADPSVKAVLASHGGHVAHGVGHPPRV